MSTATNEKPTLPFLINDADEHSTPRGTAYEEYIDPDKKPAMAQGGHYEDTLMRESGHWKFHRREAFRDIPLADAAPAK